ncbi:hypothetical protein [Methanosarcina sp.]|uniref:hypothetical protein n=1 Tax=Methanosarcina sp. TaxID=2213 RepID=UPI003BB4F386
MDFNGDEMRRDEGKSRVTPFENLELCHDGEFDPVVFKGKLKINLKKKVRNWFEIISREIL